MRPVRLELKGFTAFRDAAELDFSGLDLFAISGPIGSGKSSLLDAMTYALYGRVERVGDRVSQLISQGQPRMAVTLEFEVGPDRYRVTRSTPAKGGTKILLEGLVGGQWRQAGEGADRVREAEQMIVRIVGLTYDGFTRSVLLPQGRFAEFMTGDPKKRRDILTELLGLSLFRRMGERAGGIARESSVRAQTMAEMLEREYAGVDASSLAVAREEAEGARKREARFAKASRELFALAKSWERERGALEELHGLVGEVQAMREQAESLALELGDLALRAKAVGIELRHASAAARKSTDVEVRAIKAREEAEGAWGPLDVLIQARTKAEGLSAAQRAADALRARLAQARECAPELVVTLEAARTALRQSRGRLQQAERGVARREDALERAQADDHAAALLAGRKAGDPCPVCGVPLGRLPKRTATGVVARARTGLEAARLTLQAANEDLVGKEKAVQAAEMDVEAALAQERRLASEVEERERDLAELVAELQPVLGTPSPLDPMGELSSRVARLRTLLDAEVNAADIRERADKDLARAEHERDRIGSAAAELRARLATDPGPLLKRAERAGGEAFVSPSMPRLPRTIDPGSIGAFAADLAKAMGLMADSLQDAVSARGTSGTRLFERASALVPEPVPDAGGLEELVEAVGAAVRAATAEAAEATQRAANLAEKIERRRELEGEAAEAARRATRFRALAAEFRADRLIAFLQAEALHVLAAVGSQRLQTLSEGRYRLACRDDEFLVVDTWNGDDERSVRTLSGGETFLASLALALALSEQVRSLSVTDRAGLESLFLDEGFGTLDSEALVVVVDAIEQLGGDGRLVGVITHVGELAEQFPRVEVEKSPRGSRLKLVAT